MEEIRHYVHGRFTIEELLGIARVVLPNLEEAMYQAARAADTARKELHVTTHAVVVPEDHYDGLQPED